MGKARKRYDSSNIYEEKLSFLTSVMEALPCLVSYVDKDLKYQYMNETYHRWYKTDHKAMMGKSVPEFLGPRAYAMCKDYIARALKGENVKFRMETSGVGEDPTRRTVLVNYIPDRDEKGEVRGFFAIVNDLTNEIEASTALQTRERELNHLFNAVPSMIAHWSAGEIMLNCNASYAAAIGKTPEQIIGKRMYEILGMDLYKSVKHHVVAVLGGVNQKYERTFISPKGEPRDVLMNYLPDIVDGRVVGYFVVAADVTEKNASDERRRKLELNMIASNKMAELGEMAGGIAHEINSPLMTILNSAEVLREIFATHPLDEKAGEQYLSMIVSTTDRIARIIRGLRSFSRNADNDPMLECDLNTLIESTAEMCRERLKTHEIKFTVQCEPNLTLECREAQISQILLNLIGNALDAIDKLDEKWIRLEADEIENMIRIKIVDSGKGIPSTIAAKIMQPFFTTKEIGKGTGLGLSVSFGLAEAHNGKLYYSDGEKNTTFCLSLPRRQITKKAG